MHTLAGQYSYGYDLAGHMNSLSTPNDGVSGWGYQDNGWLQTQTLGNGVTTTYAWNQRGFLTDLQSAPSGQGIASEFGNILSDAVGNRTSLQATVNGVAGFSGALTYGYQAPSGSLDQLTGEQSMRGSGYNFAYTPDPAGNLQAIRGASGIQYDGDNQISNLATVHYDLAGNPTTYLAPNNQPATLTFDAENRLTSWTQGTSTVTFGYTGDGLRAWKQVGSSTSSRIYYLYDGSQPVAELNYNGTVLNATNTFGANGLLSRNVGGTSRFYTFGPQGDVCQRFGSSANLLSTDEYDAFGMLQGTTQTGAADVYGFGAQWGYQTDPETGLLLLTNRYYDPGLGRFLNRDPLGQTAGANLYGYVGNNPTSFADPSGLFSKEDAFVTGFGILGGIGGAWACLGNPICIAAGAALGAATAHYELHHDVGAALDTGAQAAALAGSLGCLNTFLPEESGELPIHPLYDRFYVQASELTNEENVEGLHPINPEQLYGSEAVGHAGVANLSNEELTVFGGPQGNDPITGFRSYPSSGADYSKPGPVINVLGGHHRVYEIGQRVLGGTLSPDTLVEFQVGR
jgi:RHS repeat-associated protein